jgi:lipoate-protein ligase A
LNLGDFKKMSWKIIDTGPEKAKVIMQKDQDLLASIQDQKDPILHFYEWNGASATYGYFVDPADFFCIEAVEKAGLSLARRPTGGGIIFHLWDFAFSALVPSSHERFSENTMENYAFINQAVLQVVQDFLGVQGELELTPTDAALLGKGCERFCMAKPTRYDVMWHGKKIAGAAQRKTKHGFLHQGSISLVMPSLEFLRSVLRPELSVLDAMATFTSPLLGAGRIGEEKAVFQAKEKIKELLKIHLCTK